MQTVAEREREREQIPMPKLANKSIKRRRRHAALGWWQDCSALLCLACPFLLLIPSPVAWACARGVSLCLCRICKVPQAADPTKLATVDGLIVPMQPRRMKKGLGWAMSGDFCWD